MKDLILINGDLKNFLQDNVENQKFGDIVNHYLYKRNITTTHLSRNSGVDRKLISKFISTPAYHPSKDTVLAVCIGLELYTPEARELLAIAGYTFAENSVRDWIVIYALDHGIYNIEKVNDLLNSYGEKIFKNCSKK